jgi:hypothetical protein
MTAAPDAPNPRGLLAEAAECRRQGDLAAAAAAELDALRAVHAAPWHDRGRVTVAAGSGRHRQGAANG